MAEHWSQDTPIACSAGFHRGVKQGLLVQWADTPLKRRARWFRKPCMTS